MRLRNNKVVFRSPHPTNRPDCLELSCSYWLYSIFKNKKLEKKKNKTPACYENWYLFLRSFSLQDNLIIFQEILPKNVWFLQCTCLLTTNCWLTGCQPLKHVMLLISSCLNKGSYFFNQIWALILMDLYWMTIFISIVGC